MSTQDDKATVDLKPDQDQSETDGSDEGKVLKKPDKILPCHRCSSMDTKLCYYTNNNVNQPDGIASRIDALDLSQQALPCISAPTMPLKGNGTVLKFGTEAPLCESITSVLNLRDQKRSSDCSPMACGDNREEPSCVSSVAASNCVENGYANNTIQSEQNSHQGFGNGATPMHNLQCYPGPPWPYTWGPSLNNVAAAENCHPSAIPWSGPPPIMAAPAFFGPAIPFPFMATPFWGCMPGWTNGPWNVPWVGPNGGLSPTSSTSNSGCSGSGSPTLGKHSRDASSQAEDGCPKL